MSLVDRYRKEWYVVTLDDEGETLSSQGPYAWPRAECIRERLRASRPTDTPLIRRRP